MTDFLTADTSLPSYMMFPRFLLDMEINETAKMLYIILLDRARLSQKNEGWSDTNGHVFLYFTIEALAEVLHKSQMTVKTALAVLEKQELIFRKRQGPGHPNRIYVKIPKETLSNTDRILSSTEEIEELKSAKEQLLFQAECSTEKDMASLSRKYDQMDKNLDILDSQDMALKEQLEKDAVAFQEEKLRPKPEQYTELLDARIQIRPTFREKLIEQLKGTFGEYYDYHYRDIATHEVDDLNMEDPYSFSHRTWELEYQRKQELQKKHPVQSRQKSHNTEL